MHSHPEFSGAASLFEALDHHALFSGGPKTVLLMACRGWNDAGEAASGALRHLRRSSGGTLIAEISDEEYFDYQVLRPRIRREENGTRSLRWPGTRLYQLSDELTHPHTFIVAEGPEPSFAWQSYTEEFGDLLDDLSVDAVVFMGAMMADVPHTRPLPTFISTDHAGLQSSMGLSASEYTGPTGILGVLSLECGSRGLPAISAWVSVPHYVGQSPSPKGQRALIGALEEIFSVVWEDAELRLASEKWEQAIDALAEQDEDIARYVAKLERALDSQIAAADPPQDPGLTEEDLPSAESLAEEIEQFLSTRRGGSTAVEPPRQEEGQDGDPEDPS